MKFQWEIINGWLKKKNVCLPKGKFLCFCTTPDLKCCEHHTWQLEQTPVACTRSPRALDALKRCRVPTFGSYGYIISIDGKRINLLNNQTTQKNTQARFIRKSGLTWLAEKSPSWVGKSSSGEFEGGLALPCWTGGHLLEVYGVYLVLFAYPMCWLTVILQDFGVWNIIPPKGSKWRLSLGVVHCRMLRAQETCS